MQPRRIEPVQILARIQQQGMNSPLTRPGRLSGHEYLIPKLGKWWIEHTVDRGVAVHGL